MKSFFRFWGSVLIGAYVFAPVLVLAAGPAPTCSMFTNPSSIPIGGSVTLTWASTNATAAAITNVGNVEPNGSRNLLPSGALTTTYFGSFTGPGGTANCSASVTVTSNFDNSTDSGVTGGGGTDTHTNTGTGQFATNPAVGSSGGTDASKGGLVSCGTGDGAVAATNCQACHLADLVQRIINFIIGVSIPVAAALFAYAGILYFTSGARPANIETAKGIFANAFVGFLIVLGSWLVINTTLHILLDQTQFSNGSWFQIKCSDNRKVTGDVNDIFKGLPDVVITPISPIITVGGGPRCNSGGTYSVNNGLCEYNNLGGTDTAVYGLPQGYKCPPASNPQDGGCVDMESGAPVHPVSQNGSINGSSQLVSTNNGQFTCDSCAPIDPSIPVKNAAQACSSQVAGSCQMDASLQGNFLTLKNTLPSDLRWEVTEAWPPTVRHQSSEQNAGLSVDAALRVEYTQANVAAFQDAARNSGLCAVYEPAAGTSCGGNASCLALSTTRASHFSVYKAGSSGCR